VGGGGEGGLFFSRKRKSGELASLVGTREKGEKREVGNRGNGRALREETVVLTEKKNEAEEALPEILTGKKANNGGVGKALKREQWSTSNIGPGRGRKKRGGKKKKGGVCPMGRRRTYIANSLKKGLKKFRRINRGKGEGKTRQRRMGRPTSERKTQNSKEDHEFLHGNENCIAW